MLSFRDRAVVVTGAAGGLGRAYARGFAARGASLLLNDLPESGVEELAAELGAAADTSTVATREGGAAVVEHALERFGRLDVLVNNAGIARPNYLEDLAWDDLEETLAVHLLGAFHVTKPAWQPLSEQGGGAVVNTTSAVGLFGQPRSSGYGAAKMGVVGLTRVLALEGAPLGIRVNAIAPVAVSPMAGAVYGPLTPKLDPDLVAAAVLALAHESCPLTGEVVSAGGGRLARLVIGAAEGLFDEALDPERAAAFLRDGFESLAVSAPGSAMAEIDLIRVRYPELAEPMRYEPPPREA